MNKTITVLLLASLAVSLVSCGTELPESSFVGTEASADVIMSAQFDVYSPDFERIQLTLTNGTDGVIEFGAMYELEVMVENNWKKIPFAENTGFNSLLYMVEPGGSHSFGVSRRMFDYDFDEGRYRVVKQIGSEYASAEFTLAEGGIGKDNPYGYYGIDTLPEEYYPNQAVSDGCVDISDITEADSSVINRFLRDYMSGANTQLRYFYTVDDGLYIYDILFERPATDRIKLTEDATRAGGGITVRYFSGIVTDGNSVYLSDSYAFDADRAVSFMDDASWEGKDSVIAELSKKNDADVLWIGSEVSVWSPDGMKSVQYRCKEPLEFGVTVIYPDGGNSGSMNSLPEKLDDGTRLVSITDAVWQDAKTVTFTVKTENGTAKVLYDTESYSIIG